MMLISHRGNIKGSCPDLENKPKSIDFAIQSGFYVEVDVWNCNWKWFIGHDNPFYEINENYLIDRSEKLLCHAKNLKALERMLPLELNCFYHCNDAYTISSKCQILAKPGSLLTKSCISLMPEYGNYKPEDLIDIKGICSDKIMEFEK